MSFEEAWASLHDELEHWPAWHLSSLDASSMTGTHHDGEWGGKDSGWWYETRPTSWCATVTEDGWTPKDHTGPAEWGRPRFLHWGSSPADALAGLRDLLKERRENPHLAHIYDHLFLTECADCRTDWTNAGNDPLIRDEWYA